ncbi:MAG: hypothetical protein KDD44_01045 [Bdellovibrionales bacterium]|nr:hypothetical protein [Bdellovibrionales bacterium]
MIASYRGFIAFFFLFVFAVPFETRAEETRVDVRVLSKGAKFIGTSMGGVEVTIVDATTGELLSRGITKGSTGDTQKIMKLAQPHHAPVSTEDAAVFRAEVDIEEPRLLKVTARGPLAQRQSMGEVSATQWVVPGKDITGGDGLLLEMPGFVVDVLNPPAHQKLGAAPVTVELKANVSMMCGCPIEPGGLWDADKLEVRGIVKRDGKQVGELNLAYAGSTSQFTAPLKLEKRGAYEITVYAYDPTNGNTGVDTTSVVVQ